jgi:hypothetical protein
MLDGVNKFSPQKLQHGAVRRSSLQLYATPLSLPVILLKISCYCRSRPKASTFSVNKNGNA